MSNINTQTISASLKKLVYRYELVTATYVLETWEKCLFNAIMFILLTLTLKQLPFTVARLIQLSSDYAMIKE
ncbi:unnamed protein product [Cunninghamella blakesleeana]